MARRLLLAWELGGGLGHLTNLRTIALRCLELGIEPVAAVPSAAQALRAWPGSQWPAIAAPSARHPRRSLAPPETYADILWQGGFDNEDALVAAVWAWQRVFAEHRIDALLLDYAPIAQLAGWLSGLPMTAYGAAISLPPLPLPHLRPWVPVGGQVLQRSQDRLLHRIVNVARRLGCSTPPTLAQWLHAPRRFMNGIDEVNPFGPFPAEKYLGPPGRRGDPPSTALIWPGGPLSGRPMVLAYLKTSKAAEDLLKVVAGMDVSVLCAMPGAPAHWCRRYNSKNVTILTTAIALSATMQVADLVISHSSAGTVCEALLAGKPQLLVPLDAEKALITRRVAATKAARGLMPESVSARVAGELQSLLCSNEAKKAATAIADQYVRIDWANRLDRMLCDCVSQ
jgi:hypothetical protein